MRTRAIATVGTPRIAVLTLVLALPAQSLVVLVDSSLGQLQLNLLLQSALLAVFAVWSKRAAGTLLNAPLLVASALYFWHSTFLAGHFLLPLEGFVDTGAIFRYGEAFLPQASALVALCLSTIVGGSLTGYAAERRQAIVQGGGAPVKAKASTPSHQPLIGRARHYAWGLLLGLCVLHAAYLVLEGQWTFGLPYMDLYTAASTSLPERVYQSTKFFGVIVIMMAFAVAPGSARSLRAVVALTAAVIWTGLLLGSRSVPFIYALAFLVCLDHFVRRFSSLELCALAVGASALSFIIDHSREFGVGLQVLNLSQTGRTIDLLHIFSNAGGSIQTVLRTMEFSQDQAFLYGRSFLDAIVYLLPRALVDGAGLKTGFVRPSEWLIDNSRDMLPGEGLGYSLVAEAYLNFGFAGCAIFAVLGWWIARKYFRGVLRGDRFAWLHAFNVAVVLSLHLRTDAAGYLRVLVYGYLMIEGLRLMAVRIQPVPRWRTPQLAAGLRPDIESFR